MLNLTWFYGLFFTLVLFHCQSHSNSIFEIISPLINEGDKLFGKYDFSTEEKIGFLKKKSDFDHKSQLKEKYDFSTEEKIGFLKKKSDFDHKSQLKKKSI